MPNMQFKRRAFGILEEELGRAESDYMTRFHLTPWDWWPFQRRLYLHGFKRPDSDADPHDHPFAFRSIILWGGYTEESWTKWAHDEQRCYECCGGMPCEERDAGFEWQRSTIRRWPLMTHKVPAEGIHRISKLHAKRVWTLVIRGPKTQDWGFWMGLPRVNAHKVLGWQYIGLPGPEEPAYVEP